MQPWSSIFTTGSSYKKQARFAAILWTLLIFVACLWPGKELPHSDIPFIDKWVHFVMFGVFSLLWLCGFPAATTKNLFFFFILGCMAGYLAELLQGAFPSLGRSKDNMDAVADAIGSFLGVLVFYLFAKLAAKKS